MFERPTARRKKPILAFLLIAGAGGRFYLIRTFESHLMNGNIWSTTAERGDPIAVIHHGLAASRFLPFVHLATCASFTAKSADR
jgi:hypothetical protein